jgi:MFS transporter, ACS family, hexuronate transporter
MTAPKHLAPGIALPARGAGAGGRFRWVICALLFLATTINYMDRQILGVLKSTLMDELAWSEIDYSNIVFGFAAAYAIGYAAGGWLMDRIGVRIGLALCVVVWSFAAGGHAFVRSVAGFTAMRMILGLAEGGNFPAAIKTVGEWFPKKERALATGIFNAGCNVAVMITPFLIPWITLHFGWPKAFLAVAAMGFIWLAVWWPLYRSPSRHPRVSPAELAYIQSDPPDPVVKVSWLSLLRHRQTWAFVVGMLTTSPVWWFYLYWVPGFLHQKHGLNLMELGPPLLAIYIIADIGSIGGGWFSSHLIKRGWQVGPARKTAMLICALCVVPVFAAAITAGTWTATLLIGLAAAAHQGFAANLYTLVSDTAPRFAISSIVGIGGMAAGIGGMFNAKLVGYVLEWTGNYLPLFIIASCTYVIALAIIHFLNPRHDPMSFTESELSSPRPA